MLVFTTRPDTLGASFIALSPQHPRHKLAETNENIAAFLTECAKTGTSEAATEKKGVFTDLYVDHPVKDGSLIYIANFVLMDMAQEQFGCPAHDQRDLILPAPISLMCCRAFSERW